MGEKTHSSISTCIEDFEATSCSQWLRTSYDTFCAVDNTSSAWKRLEFWVHGGIYGVQIQRHGVCLRGIIYEQSVSGWSGKPLEHTYRGILNEEIEYSKNYEDVRVRMSRKMMDHMKKVKEE